MTTPNAVKAVGTRRGLTWLASLLGVLVILLGATAMPAAAGPKDDWGGGGDRGYGACVGTSVAESSRLLPVTRWQDATGFHSRIGGFAIEDQLQRISTQGLVESGMSVSNWMWSASTDVIQFAYSFCPISKVGGTMDKAFYKISTAVISSPLLAILTAASIFVWIWRIFSQGSNDFGRLIWQKALVTSLLVIMVVGAAGSKGGTGAGSEAYVPGFGSPGWFITTVDTTMSSVAGSIVTALTFTDPAAQPAGSSALEPSYNSKSKYSCESYVASLEQEYRDRMGKDLTGAAAVPLALNSYWKSTTLETWKGLQFGKRNNYGNIMWCRMLEENAGSTVKQYVTKDTTDVADPPSWGTISGIMSNTGAANIKPEAPAWSGSASNTYQDRIYVAWAACSWVDGKWDIAEDRKPLYGDGISSESDAQENCKALFAADGMSTTDNLNAFDWGDGGGDIDDDMSDDVQNSDAGAAASDYLKHMHGVGGGNGLVSVLALVIASLAVLVVFGLFGAAIIWAKILGLMMIVGVLFSLLASMTPSGDTSKIGGYFKQYIGISFFAFSAGLLLSIVTIITSVLIDIGATTLPGGPGGFMSILWTGMAPFMALFSLHYMFKRLQLPSPLSVKAAGAWGKAAANGNLGSAVAGGVAGGAAAGIASRWGQRGRDKALAATKDSIKSRIGRGKGGPDSSSVPDGHGKQSLPGRKDSDAAEDSTPTLADKADEIRSSRAEKRETKKTDAEEKQEFLDSDEGKAALAAREEKGLTGRMKDGLSDRRKAAVKKVKDGATVAWDQFKSKPVSTSIKGVKGAAAGLGKGALYTGAGALAVATGPLGLAVGGAALMKTQGGRRAAGAVARATGRGAAAAGSGIKDGAMHATYLGGKGAAGAGVAGAREASNRDATWREEKARRLSEAEETARHNEQSQPRRSSGSGSTGGSTGSAPASGPYAGRTATKDEWDGMNPAQRQDWAAGGGALPAGRRMVVGGTTTQKEITSEQFQRMSAAEQAEWMNSGNLVEGNAYNRGGNAGGGSGPRM